MGWLSAYRPAAPEITRAARNGALHNHDKGIAAVISHRRHREHPAVCDVARPAPDVVLFHIGKGQQEAVIAHAPYGRAGGLLVGPLLYGVPLKQVRRKNGKIVARVAVFFQRIKKVAHTRAVALYVQHRVADDDGRAPRCPSTTGP